VRKKYGDTAAVVGELEKQQASESLALAAELTAAKQSVQDSVDVTSAANLKAANEREATDKKAKLEGDLIALREDFEATQVVKQELALFEMEQALGQENLTEGERYKIKEEYAAKKEELDKASAEKEKQLAKDVTEATKQVATQGLAAAQGLSDAFFGAKLAKVKKGSAEELALEKKKFEVNKKLQIAQAIMQGTQATLAAFASGSAIPIVGAVTGPVFATAAAVTAGLNITKIKNTSFTGGGGSEAPAVATPSVTAPSVTTAPTQQVQGADAVTQTLGLQGSGSTKVVIVDSEIKAALDRNEQTKVVSSFG
jgi:hypothetical protein